jgi:cytidylate kinase
MLTTYNIIVIEREYGAGGSVIAAKLAERLGWKLYDQQLTAEIARIARVDRETVARCDEQCDPLLYRLAKVFWRGSYERMIPLPDDDRLFDTDRMVSLAQQLIEDTAKQGRCVFVGRGSPYILRDRKDHFSVFLYAPRDLKIRRAMAQKMSAQEAAELVDTIDEERATFVKRYFGTTWPTRALYNLMLNTACGYEMSVDLILQAMEITAAAPLAK